MHEVHVDPVNLERLERFLLPERVDELRTVAASARERLSGVVVWNVNSTAHGGGVAEMLQGLLAYGRGAGIDTRWLVLDGDPEFFLITKRLHNFLHGFSGDGGPLGSEEAEHYRTVLESNLASLVERIRPGDIVLAHDPQTAGLVPGLQAAGARVAWRCHIGRDEPSELHDVGWAFLRPYLEGADALVFSRRQYAPSWTPQERLWVVAPSLDPFSGKNTDLSRPDVASTLRVAGLVDTATNGGSIEFGCRTGERGRVRRRDSLILDEGPIPRDARIVLQVSRWDALKDMAGVLRGFADRIDDLPSDAHLLLAGPDVLGVTDDPEGAAVLASCRSLRDRLPAPVRDRVHLTALPMDDGDENAHLVNALQRYAAVVVQKSLVEGFGLTVTEPMWKSRPVVASAVGGIQDQIVDGVSGLLLSDPTDLDAFAAAVGRVLRDEEMAHRLGAAAHVRVQERFLGDRHLIQYGELLGAMVDGGRPS